MLLNLSAAVWAEEEAETEAVTTEDFTITVETDERQTYEGFGFSLVSDFIYNAGAEAQEKAYKLMYDDLNTNAVRLWFNNEKYFKGQDESTWDLSYFRSYHKIGQNSMLDGAIARGIEHLLLAPSGMPGFMTGEDINPATGEKATYSSLKPSMADTYAYGLAKAVYDLREEGIPITATGIYNEPASFQASVMAMVIPKLRAYLDELDCKDVIIVAPEKANNDTNGYKYLNTLIEDPECLKAIDALSTHSYNMGLTKQTADITIKSGIKRFWQTESSITGNGELDNDYAKGATTASRFLNDMNHMVTEWFNFQGIHTNRRNSVAMCGYTNGEFYPHQKYYYLKHLTSTFKKGAVFYHSTSDKEGEMEWTYGIKNKVYSATAQNPDGTWAIGICNATDTVAYDAAMGSSKFNKENAVPRDTIANVTLNVLGLSQSGKQEFNVVRTGRNGTMISEEKVIADGGVIKLVVNPCDLVTLTSVNPIEKSNVTIEVEYYEVQELILPDKPDDMTDYQYELWIQGSKVLGYDESKLPEWTPEYRTVTKQRVVNTASVDKHVVTLMLGSPLSFVNGEKKQFDENDEYITPVMVNGSTYVPIRFAEMIGGETNMKTSTSSVTIKIGNYIAEIKVGDSNMTVNGEVKDMGAAPVIMNNRIYIPLRGFVENIGKTCKWDKRGLVMITDNEELDNIVYSFIQKFMPEEEKTEENDV